MPAAADRLRTSPPAEPLDAFISPRVRAFFEDNYYARIRQSADLSAMVSDPAFLAEPRRHVALFADHGAAHARDVAQQLLHVLDAACGVVIPARPRDRLEWMSGFGVLLAYMHDIGMADTGPQGRAMHAEYVVQAALGPEFDDLVKMLGDDDSGGVTSRLSSETMLRELMALAMCHSKSKVPVAMLNDPPRLRQLLLAAAATDLAWLRQSQSRGEASPVSALDAGRAHPSRISPRLAAAYADFHRDGFAWLLPSDAAGRELLDDALDTARVLRCADALRQRGTTLKTSGNNEIFVDQQSANAVFALRLGSGRLYLLEIADPISAGEANLSGGELDRDGNLRITFHHGMFRDAYTIGFAARSAARIVSDIYADTLGSFVRAAGNADRHLEQRIADASIILEAPDDNPAFAALVQARLADLNAEVAARVRITPSLQAATPEERSRYIEGTPIEWTAARRRDFLEHVAKSGHRTDGIDIDAAFREVRQISLAAGEVLVEGGGPSGFVYIPEAGGLSGQPLGGYEPFTVPAWTPVGVTGVVRGAVRNATIVARTPLTLIAIPKAAYLGHWHRTYDTEAFATLFRSSPPPINP